MIILEACKNNGADKHIVIVTGTGLVGSALIQALTVSYSFRIVQKFKINWPEPAGLKNRLKGVSDILDGRCTNKIDWLWSAGKAGFNSTEKVTDIELALFSTFLTEVREINLKLNLERKSVVHLISTAGGLFEGQNVGAIDTIPVPKRPYGLLKLKQEQLLIKYFEGQNRIYRPSTIFGYYTKGQRMGLITALIYNTINSEVTSINGRINTLRDYVWAGDVARYVAKEICSAAPSTKQNISFLVSGKPSSVYEIITYVQQLMNARVLVKYDISVTNADNIIFPHYIAPSGWKVSSLETSIKLLYHDLLLHG